MSSTNAFGTFLETKELLREGDERSSATDVATQPEDALRFSQAVKLLLKGSFPTTLPELMGESKLSLAEFTESVGLLERSGLITVEDPEGRQLASLTEQGQKLITA
jgi:hypothetical protein